MTKLLDQLALPQDPEKQKKFKIMLNEVLASIQKQEQEKEAYKDILDEIVNEFALPAKIVNKLIRTLHKQNYSEIKQEHELLELLYDTVVK